MQNFKQEGCFLTLPAAPYDLQPGDGAKVGSIFGVSANVSPVGTECVLGTEGVYELLKVASPDTFSVGAPVYWDDAVKACTATATGNTRIGVATALAANMSVTVEVRLNGSF